MSWRLQVATRTRTSAEFLALCARAEIVFWFVCFFNESMLPFSLLVLFYNVLDPCLTKRFGLVYQEEEKEKEVVHVTIFTFS